MKLQILRKIAKEWIKQINKKPEEIIVHPLNHIKSVDGVDCYIRLHFELTSSDDTATSMYRLTLKITPYIVNDRSNALLWNYFLFCNNDEHIIINNENDLARVLNDYAKMLKHLKFDRLRCSFYAPINYMIETEIRNVFSISNSLLEAWEECSICMNHTLVKTSCNHFICVPCADKSCYVTEKTCCPLCRNENALEYIHIDS